MVREKQEEQEMYELVDVPTQTTPMIRNNETGEIMDVNMTLLHICKKLDVIEKTVG